MNDTYYKWVQSNKNYLMHYNHNHDSMGRFASSSGTTSFKYTRKDKKNAIDEYNKENPKNKGMSPIDHIYNAINKHDAVKNDKQNKRTLEKACSTASKSLSSQLRKNNVDYNDWSKAYEKGYFGNKDKKYIDQERKYYEKYKKEIERELNDMYSMSDDYEIKPTSSRSVNDIRNEQITYAYDQAVRNNIYNPATERLKRQGKYYT